MVVQFFKNTLIVGLVLVPFVKASGEEPGNLTKAIETALTGVKGASLSGGLSQRSGIPSFWPDDLQSGGPHLNRTDDNTTIECYFEKSIPELKYNKSKLVTCGYGISQCITLHNRIKLEEMEGEYDQFSLDCSSPGDAGPPACTTYKTIGPENQIIVHGCGCYTFCSSGNT